MRGIRVVPVDVRQYHENGPSRHLFLTRTTRRRHRPGRDRLVEADRLTVPNAPCRAHLMHRRTEAPDACIWQ